MRSNSFFVMYSEVARFFNEGKYEEASRLLQEINASLRKRKDFSAQKYVASVTRSASDDKTLLKVERLVEEG